jgi:hypothetical protein
MENEHICEKCADCGACIECATMNDTYPAELCEICEALITIANNMKTAIDRSIVGSITQAEIEELFKTIDAGLQNMLETEENK